MPHTITLNSRMFLRHLKEVAAFTERKTVPSPHPPLQGVHLYAHDTKQLNLLATDRFRLALGHCSSGTGKPEHYDLLQQKEPSAENCGFITNEGVKAVKRLFQERKLDTVSGSQEIEISLDCGDTKIMLAGEVIFESDADETAYKKLPTMCYETQQILKWDYHTEKTTHVAMQHFSNNSPYELMCSSEHRNSPQVFLIPPMEAERSKLWVHGIVMPLRSPSRD